MAILLINCSSSNDIKFNSSEWKTWEESEENLSLRWRMTNDLLGKNKLEGMSKNEVIQLLGIPEGQGNNELNYLLGYTGKGINTGTLSIKFVKSKVVEIVIIEG